MRAIGAIEPPAGEREILAHAARQAREIPAAADIGEQADAGFGHGEHRAFGGHAVFGRLRDADAAAHRDAVHEGDDRLGIGEQQMVGLIFVVEEAAGIIAIHPGAFPDGADVAPGAEAPSLRMIDRD